LPVIRVPYKVYPVAESNPRVAPGAAVAWVPLLSVSLMYRHAKSKRLEAYVDSGAPACLFHGSIEKGIGIKIEDGSEGKLGGVIGGIQKKFTIATSK